MHIVEEHYQEKEGILANTDQANSLQNLIDAKTILVHVTLNVTFELKAKERHRKRDEQKK